MPSISSTPSAPVLAAPHNAASTAALTYVVLTAARNEERYIEHTLRSMVAQTARPLRWIIVSDGSTDRTDEIVRGYASQHPWIELIRLPERRERQFAAKANGINTAYARLANERFDVVCNLDADVSFESDFFAFLLARLAEDTALGVVGTAYIEEDSSAQRQASTHTYANLTHVSGQCQVFRRQCFEDVGGYVPVKGGAIDWIAVTTARMRKWKTRTFPEKTFFHHRLMGTADRSILRSRFHYGRKAYYVGGHPVWELLRGCFDMRKRPWIFGGIAFQLGFVWAAVTRVHRPVSRELMAFHRREQMDRLNVIIRRTVGLRRS